VYRNFDWDGPLDFVRKAAGLSDRVRGDGVREASGRPTGDGAVAQWFAANAPVRGLGGPAVVTGPASTAANAPLRGPGGSAAATVAAATAAHAPAVLVAAG
jgi:hypothetical protein